MSEPDDNDLWVVGDVQGYLNSLRRVLGSVALLDATGSWAGAGASLFVLGDLVDRGPNGIGVIELLMRLQGEAMNSGGRVEVVIGNHDMLLLAARKFGPPFLESWRFVGGVESDFSGLTSQHVAWLENLPALLVSHDALFMHADALFYLEYGSSVEEVNARFADILVGDDAAAWDHLLDAFAEHRAFLGPDGCANLDRVLAAYGGHRLLHGHTPVARITREPPETVSEPYVYCDGRCVDVDPGIYLGGPGFAYNLRRLSL